MGTVGNSATIKASGFNTVQHFQVFCVLNLKGLQEVGHLGPNQIPTSIETCWNLLFLSD